MTNILLRTLGFAFVFGLADFEEYSADRYAFGVDWDMCAKF